MEEKGRENGWVREGIMGQEGVKQVDIWKERKREVSSSRL
jgi:hypothetical protein